MKQLAENEVSVKSLIDIYESAFMKVTDATNDSFKVQCEDFKPKIFIDEKRKYLRFSIVYGLSGGITLTEAKSTANKVNDEYILIRFMAFEVEGDILIESCYYMTYEEGLIAYQAIKIAKKFEQFTVTALRENFNNYL